MVKWLGKTIAWVSRTQKIVALSTSESEYVAFAECGAEVKHLLQLWEEVKEDIKPAKLCGDNMGSLLMSENVVWGNRTKHIDVRYHFIKELIQRGIIKGEYINTLNNMADGHTKNLDIKKFERQKRWWMNTVKQEEEQDLGRAPNRESVAEDNQVTKSKCSSPPQKIEVTRKVTRTCKAYPK